MSYIVNVSYNARIFLRNLSTETVHKTFELSSKFLQPINNGICFVRLLNVSVSHNASHFKHRDRRDLLRSVPKVDEGLGGTEYVSLNASITTKEDMFTDERTPNLLFNGVPFKYIPVCSIHVTKNNCKFYLGDAENKRLVSRTNGMEGFKNCRKGTNVAAQSTALTVGNKALALGVKDIRIKVRGLGPGRMAAIKGLEMSGLNIISITDDTRIAWRPICRPRKARRL